MKDYYYTRPLDDMFHIENDYYPEGKSENEAYIKNLYVDRDGKEFNICYTEDQFNEHIKNNCGIFFPYTPLMITKSLL